MKKSFRSTTPSRFRSPTTALAGPDIASITASRITVFILGFPFSLLRPQTSDLPNSRFPLRPRGKRNYFAGKVQPCGRDSLEGGIINHVYTVPWRVRPHRVHLEFGQSMEGPGWRGDGVVVGICTTPPSPPSEGRPPYWYPLYPLKGVQLGTGTPLYKPHWDQGMPYPQVPLAHRPPERHKPICRGGL